MSKGVIHKNQAANRKSAMAKRAPRPSRPPPRRTGVTPTPAPIEARAAPGRRPRRRGPRAVRRSAPRRGGAAADRQHRLLERVRGVAGPSALDRGVGLAHRGDRRGQPVGRPAPRPAGAPRRTFHGGTPEVAGQVGAPRPARGERDPSDERSAEASALVTSTGATPAPRAQRSCPSASLVRPSTAASATWKLVTSARPPK